MIWLALLLYPSETTPVNPVSGCNLGLNSFQFCVFPAVTHTIFVLIHAANAPMGVTTRTLVIFSSTGSKGTAHGYEYDPVNNFCFVSLDLQS